MVKTKQICTEATPEEVAALLKATGTDNTKAALNDAMGYRIKHPNLALNIPKEEK